MSDDMMKMRLSRLASAPGDNLEGEVLLQFPSMVQDKMKEVYVKLYGSLTVYVYFPAPIVINLTKGYFRSTVAYEARNSMVKSKTEHKLDLTRDKLTVWRRGTYPPAGSNTLAIPFKFKLSNQLPYTCKFAVNHPETKVTSEISYHVEVVGDRQALRAKRRQRTAFRVIPSLTRGVAIQEELASAWPGEWRTVSRERRIPLGTTGGYSHVQFSVSHHV